MARSMAPAMRRIALSLRQSTPRRTTLAEPRRATREAAARAAAPAAAAGGIVAVALVAGVGGAAASASAAGAQDFDQGRLYLHVGGERIGTESFRVWASGSIVDAVANIEIAEQSARRVGLRMDGELRPVRYSDQGPAATAPGDGAPDGATVTVTAERGPDRIRVHVFELGGEDGEVESWREVPPREADVILDPSVAHHYLLLWLSLRESPEGALTALIPRERRSVSARLDGSAPDEVRVGEESVPATRYDLVIDGHPRRVWLDAEERLLRVLDPQTGREAVRAANN